MSATINKGEGGIRPQLAPSKNQDPKLDSELALQAELYRKKDPVKFLLEGNSIDLVNPLALSFIANQSGFNEARHPNNNVGFQNSSLGVSTYVTNHTGEGFNEIIPGISQINYAELENIGTQNSQQLDSETIVPADEDEISKKINIPAGMFKIQDLLTHQNGSLVTGIVRATPILAREMTTSILLPQETDLRRQANESSYYEELPDTQNEQTKNWPQWTRGKIDQVWQKYHDPIAIEIDTSKMPTWAAKYVEEKFNDAFRQLASLSVKTLFNGTSAELLVAALNEVKIDKKRIPRLDKQTKERINSSMELLCTIQKCSVIYFASLINVNFACLKKEGKPLLTVGELAFIARAVTSFYTGVDKQGNFQGSSTKLINLISN